MDNGPARVKKVSYELQNSGDLISDIAEVSFPLKQFISSQKMRITWITIIMVCTEFVLFHFFCVVIYIINWLKWYE